MKHESGARFSFDVGRDEAWMRAYVHEPSARTKHTAGFAEGPGRIIKVGVGQHRHNSIERSVRKGQMTCIRLKQLNV